VPALFLLAESCRRGDEVLRPLPEFSLLHRLVFTARHVEVLYIKITVKGSFLRRAFVMTTTNNKQSACSL
jgi:hypothetical protein